MKISEKMYENIRAIEFAIIAFIIANAISALVWIGFVPSTSMYPTLKVGTIFIANTMDRSLGRGDIAIFQPDKPVSKAPVLVRKANVTLGRNETYIKRVIGLPGDTIEIKDGILYLNDKAQHEPYVYDGLIAEDFEKTTVSEGCYFFMGDNRNNSHDSRYIGEIPANYVEGKVYFFFTPFQST